MVADIDISSNINPYNDEHVSYRIVIDLTKIDSDVLEPIYPINENSGAGECVGDGDSNGICDGIADSDDVGIGLEKSIH